MQTHQSVLNLQWALRLLSCVIEPMEAGLDHLPAQPLYPLPISLCYGGERKVRTNFLAGVGAGVHGGVRVEEALPWGSPKWPVWWNEHLGQEGHSSS